MKINRKRSQSPPAFMSDDLDVLSALAFVAALFVLTMILLASGCATTGTTVVTPASENATVTVQADPAQQLANILPYADLANAKAFEALQLYMATQDATTLQKLTYWLNYASGVAARLEQIASGQN